MQNSIIAKINKSFEKKRPGFRVGDKVNVQVRLKEGDKERIQAFRGVVISKQPKSGLTPTATFTVRKISAGVGVERIFPVHSPYIDRIEVESSSTVRRSRLYYLRNLKGKKARLKESEHFEELILAEESPLDQAFLVETAAGPVVATGESSPASGKVEDKAAASDEKPKGKEEKKPKG